MSLNKETLITIRHKKEIAELKDDLQDLADALNVPVSVAHTDDTGFEQLVFTPKSFAKNNHPSLFKDEDLA